MRLAASLALTIAAFLPPVDRGFAQPSANVLDGRTFFLPLVVREAGAHGLPPEIADAVAVVETNYRPDAIGSSGEIGLMQVMPATAAQLGFRGSSAELADPNTNIRLGVAYLARAWRVGGGDICRALTKYRAGLGQEVITPLSAQYCARATAWLMGGRGTVGDTATGPGPGSFNAKTPDRHAIVMPVARPRLPRRVLSVVPLLPMPEGVRLTPIFAMVSASAPQRRPAQGHPSRKPGSSLSRQNAAETSASSDD